MQDRHRIGRPPPQRGSRPYRRQRHVLTGSCKAGREAFCRDNGIDIENDTFTIHEFVSLTKDSYGGETIKKLVDNERN